jgi:hypothetical protein
MTLRRAAEIAGGEQQLAFLLKVTPSHLALWLAGAEVPPGYIFLRAVDIVTEHDLAKLSSAPPEMQKPGDDEPPPPPDRTAVSGRPAERG